MALRTEHSETELLRLENCRLASATVAMEVALQSASVALNVAWKCC
jgi:hypothetical protein